MQRVEELRKRIDAADDTIVAALKARFKLTREMRTLKAELKLPAKDEAREREIYSRVIAMSAPDERDTIYGVYEKIFSGSRGIIETVARGVAIVEGKVLLCKSKGDKPTYLPGGHIEFGETGREALVREVKEETGLDSTAGDFLGVVENSFIQGGEKHCEINLIYRLNLLSPLSSLISSQEPWLEFVWWDIADIDNARLLPEAMKEYIK